MQRRRNGIRAWTLGAFLLLLFACVAPLLAQGEATRYKPNIPPRAIAYQRSKRVLGLSSLAWSMVGLGLAVKTGLSARWRDRVYRLTRRRPPEGIAPPPFRALALYLLGFFLLWALWRYPFGLINLWLERHYGFGRETVGGHLWDTLLRAVYDLVLLPVFWGGYRLYAWSPRRWHLWLWAGLLPLLFAQSVLAPILVAPAFHRYTPLEPGLLREKILALAARSGISGGRVFVEDTSRRTRHVNAYVFGVGPTTRIVLNDTALHSLPEDQLLAMMGHEMGHYVEGHLWVGLASNWLGAGAFLWLAAWLIRRTPSPPDPLSHAAGEGEQSALSLPADVAGEEKSNPQMTREEERSSPQWAGEREPDVLLPLTKREVSENFSLPLRRGGSGWGSSLSVEEGERSPAEPFPSTRAIRGATDLAALPMAMLVLSLFLLAQSPIANYQSRLLERRADAFGLRVTGLDEAMIRLFVGFAERDYADPDPPVLLHLWFGTHPTLSERIAFVQAFRRPEL